jgi:hypothetical protein
MISIDCNSDPFNPYCTCFDNEGKSVPKYRQYNADRTPNSQNNNSVGIGARCCNDIHLSPAYLANKLPSIGPISTNSEYLSKLNDTDDLSFCDYTKYYDSNTASDKYLEENFPELNYKASVNRKLFNTFFQYQSSIQNNNVSTNRDLVPVVSENGISCKAGYVPHWLIYNYYDLPNKDIYVHMCLPNNVNSTVSLADMTYEIKNIKDNTDTGCESNICTTTHNPNIAYNIGSSVNKNNVKPILSGLEIALIVVFALLFFAGYVGLLYHVGGFSKRRNTSRKTLEGQLDNLS